MANCCPGGGCPTGSCPSYDTQFDEKSARQKLAELRSRGPRGTTADLIEALSAGGVDGATVLDIGAGVGAVHLGLIERGAASATDVDASAAYTAAAHEEAVRRGLADRVRNLNDDFVRVASSLEPADIVALDRVVCCYGDVTALVSNAARLARRRLGLVYPVDRWWVRIGIGIENLLMAAKRDPFRAYIHPTAVVDRLVREAGLEPRVVRRGAIWQVIVYERPGSPMVSAGSR